MTETLALGVNGVGNWALWMLRELLPHTNAPGLLLRDNVAITPELRVMEKQASGVVGSVGCGSHAGPERELAFARAFVVCPRHNGAVGSQLLPGQHSWHSVSSDSRLEHTVSFSPFVFDERTQNSNCCSRNGLFFFCEWFSCFIRCN